MGEQTDDDDGQRPLTPDERNFLRALRPLLNDPEQLKRFKSLLEREPDITQVAQSYSHLSWGGKMMFRISIWLAGIVGGVAAYKTVSTWAGVK